MGNKQTSKASTPYGACPPPLPQVWPAPPVINVITPTPVQTPLLGVPASPSLRYPTTPPNTFTPAPSPYVYSSYIPSPHHSLRNLYHSYQQPEFDKLDTQIEKARQEKKAAEKHLKDAQADMKAAQAQAQAARYSASGTPYVATTLLGTPYVYPGTPAAPVHSIWPPPTPGVSMAVPPYGSLVLDSPHDCNIFVQPTGYTPGPPAYVGLSPSPSSYQDLDTPGTPDDIAFDKWAESNSSYMFDNRQSHIPLNSQHHVLEINPILEHGSIPLLVDLSRRKRDITMLAHPGVRWEDEDENDVGSQPATLPRVTKLRLVSPKVKQVIEVVSPKGVTVNDVLNAMFESFNANLDPVKDAAKSEQESWRRTSAYHANMKNQLWGRPIPFLRRVDLLYGEPILNGLHADPDMVYERYGERDCAVLVMNFRSREGLE